MEGAPKRPLASVAVDGALCPEPKRPHAATAPSPPSSTRNSRVVLDVGGARFVSSRNTLETGSTYFRSLFSRWTEEIPVEPIFIDADGDAFQVLLSYLRVGSILLPAHDHGLCARVLLLADFLGLEDFLSRVKRRAHANLHPEMEAETASAAGFDQEAGSLQAALDSGVLPGCYFAPAPAPAPEPPERIVKMLYPVSGYKVAFTDQDIDDVAQMDNHFSLPVLCLALLELRNGRNVVDAVRTSALCP